MNLLSFKMLIKFDLQLIDQWS